MPPVTRTSSREVTTTQRETAENDFVDAREQIEAPAAMTQANPVVVQVSQEPPKFNGRNPAKALQWLKDYESTATFNNHDAPRMLSGVRFALQDVANDWFDSSEPFATWDAFKDALKARFAGVSLAHEEALKQLRKAYQPVKKPSLEHLEVILKWCRDLNPAPDDKEKIKWFLRTSNHKYRAALFALAPDTIDNLRTKLSDFDVLMLHGNDAPDGESDDDLRYAIRALHRSPSRGRSPTRWGDNQDLYNDAPCPTYKNGIPMTPPFRFDRQRSPTRQQSRQANGPHLTGNRYNEEGVILCNWCGHPGHTIEVCLNKVRGRPAWQHAVPPARRILRPLQLTDRSPNRATSPSRNNRQPVHLTTRQPTGAPRQGNYNQPQPNSNAPTGNDNSRWSNL